MSPRAVSTTDTARGLFAFRKFRATQNLCCAKRNASASRKSSHFGKIVVPRHAEALILAKIALLRHAETLLLKKMVFLRHAEGVIFENRPFCATRKPKNRQNLAFCAVRKRSFSKVRGFASRGSTSFGAAEVLRDAEGQKWAKFKLFRDAERLLLENDSFRAAQKEQFFGNPTSASRKNSLFGQASFPRHAVKMNCLIKN